MSGLENIVVEASISIDEQVNDEASSQDLFSYQGNSDYYYIPEIDDLWSK